MAAAVEFPVLFVEFDHVHCASCGLFLVRNWCGSSAIETWTRALRSVGDNVRTQVSPGRPTASEFRTPSCRLIAAACQGQRPGSCAIGSEQKRFMGKQARRNGS